ncbi:hypothetical protein ElyMa_002812800 [Elysia marginata]|uniref:Uncharacterized protein n=1 Tax=Elysia marginata TaxID=1093978 RepID=A0AAV4HSH8_9GAST|nr:hypothetical protein ElyMa_002812800 [Elysia marginata]
MSVIIGNKQSKFFTKRSVKIKNESLYKKCNENYLSLHILESRWRLLGHILRRDIEIPANKSMEAYFVRKDGKFLGRPIRTLPNVLNKDLSRLPTGELRLKTNEDLDHLRSNYCTRQTTVERAHHENPRSSRGVRVGGLGRGRR